MDGGDTEPGENDAAGESGISVYSRTTHDIPMAHDWSNLFLV